MDLQDIRTGDIVFTTLNHVPSYLIMATTWSESTHVAIAVWISEDGIKNKKLDILPRQQDGSELCLLEMSHQKSTDFRYYTPKKDCIIIPFADSKKRLIRAKYRHLNRNIPDHQIVQKISKFINDEKDAKFSLGFRQAINIFFNVGQVDHAQPYADETCVSFVLKWLTLNGYEFDQSTPYRSRHLYSPDHLLENFNKSPVLGQTGNLHMPKTPMAEWLQVLIVMVFIIFLSIIITLLIYSFSVKTKIDTCILA